MASKIPASWRVFDLPEWTSAPSGSRSSTTSRAWSPSSTTTTSMLRSRIRWATRWIVSSDAGIAKSSRNRVISGSPPENLCGTQHNDNTVRRVEFGHCFKRHVLLFRQIFLGHRANDTVLTVTSLKFPPCFFFSHRLPQKAVRRCPTIERIARNAQAVKINWGRPHRSRHHAASLNVQQESLIHHPWARGVNDSG